MPRKSTTTTKSTKKPIKKSAASTSGKSFSKLSTKPKEQTIEQPEKTKEVKKSRSLKIKKSYIFVILAFIVIGVLLYYFRSLFVAVVVNGQPISRVAVIRETEKQSGAQALNTLIRNTLIEQEANRQHVTVPDSEIDSEIKKVETNLSKQGQKLDDVLKQQNMTRTDLRGLIRLDKLVQKMVGKDIKISDKDVDAYIEKNKEALPQGQDPKQLRQSVKDRLQQQELSSKVQTWLQDLQTKAKIVQFVQYSSSQPSQ